MKSLFKLLTISVILIITSNDLYAAKPKISNLPSQIDVIENHVFVRKPRATDPNNDGLTWSLDNSYRDSSSFSIASDGRIYLNYIPDYEDSSQKRTLRLRVQVSDASNTVSKDVVVKIKNAQSRNLSVTASPATHIVMDGSTPSNLMYDYESSTGYAYHTGEPISYDAINLDEGLSYGSYPYTLVSGFIGYFADNDFSTGASMDNTYDDYLVSTSANDDPLYIRLEQPKANADCGSSDYNGDFPLCDVHITIYKYNDDYGYYAWWKSIEDGKKNKTIKLPAQNQSYLIRISAPSEMQSNDGNSQYYLYAYRSGNTPGNVVNAFSMANSNSSDTFAWYKPDLDLSGRTDWEFADNRILVYKRDNVTRNRISDKEYFNEIKTFADKFLLKNDGFSVIELNRNQLRSLSTPANSIHNASKSLINTDSINGSLPQSTLINEGITKSNSIENIVSILNRLYPNNEFSLDFKVEAHNFQYDPDYIRYQKEYFDQVNAEEGLNEIGTYDTKNVVVAVVDTGSPTVGSRAWESSSWNNNGYDFVDSDNDPTDPSATSAYPNNGSHGTHVATTIAAKNDGKNINGFGLKAMPLRVLDENGSGYSSDVCNGIAYAGRVSNSSGQIANRKADVINMSLGGGSSCACQSVIDDVYNAGVVIVASAGNGYVQANNYPASCDNVISVSSIGSSGTKAYYSNYGPLVDVSAPGGDAYLDEDGDGDWDGIWAFTKDNKLELYQGTSMAAPIASAVIGNVIAKNKNASPSFIDNLIKKKLIVQDMGNDGFDYEYGHGMVDLSKVAQNSKKSTKSVNTFASTSSSVTNIGNNGSATINLRKSGRGNMTVTGVSTSHSGISVSASSSASSNDGFGKYTVTIDESEFNNEGRFEEVVTFQVTDSLLVDKVDHPVIFQIGNLSDSRNPANLSRMVVLAEITDGNELGQNIIVNTYRIEGQTSYTHKIEDAKYSYHLSHDSDMDFFVCDFGEICWKDELNITRNKSVNMTIAGNNEEEIYSSRDRSMVGKSYK